MHVISIGNKGVVEDKFPLTMFEMDNERFYLHFNTVFQKMLGSPYAIQRRSILLC